MNPWSTSKQTAFAQGPVLLIGPDSKIQSALVQELHALPVRTGTALDLDRASELRIDPKRPPSVVILPEDQIQPRAFEEELAELRIRTGSPRLVPIAFGPEPSAERRAEIRDAGVSLALFGRFGRHALRFQLNRALSP